MSPPTHHPIGHISKAQGLSGALRLALTATWPTNLTLLYVLQQGSYVPYPVADAALQGAYAVVTLAGIDSRTQARALQGLPVYVSQADWQAATAAAAQVALQGYTVVDAESGPLGSVTGALDQGQPCWRVSDGKRDFTLPQAMANSIDHAQKVIAVTLPHDFLRCFADEETRLC